MVSQRHDQVLCFFNFPANVRMPALLPSGDAAIYATPRREASKADFLIVGVEASPSGLGSRSSSSFLLLGLHIQEPHYRGWVLDFFEPYLNVWAETLKKFLLYGKQRSSFSVSW